MALILKLLRDTGLQHPFILELGAGSGMTTVSLLEKLGGRALLVDASREARQFFAHIHGEHPAVRYIVGDVTRFETEERFDLVFSDGVLSLLRGEEFERFMAKHLQFLNKDGLVMIIVARNSPYIRLRDMLLDYDLLYRVLLRWLGISKPSYEYERLYTEAEMVTLCRQWNLEVVRSASTYKTVCVLCGLAPISRPPR